MVNSPMVTSMVKVLVYLVPGGIANAMPPILAKIPQLSRLKVPLDLGKTINNKRILGDHKTVLGLVGGVLLGTVFGKPLLNLLLQNPTLAAITYPLENTDLFLYSFLTSLGALLGDMVKSLIKRQMNVASGKSFFPWDQLDFLLGIILTTKVFFPQLQINILLTLLLGMGLHLVFTYLGYLLKIRKDPI